MIKTARILFVIVGTVFPILVGILHMLAHFKDLLAADVQQVLSAKIMILGEEEVMFNAWGVMSVMMGISFIVIGLLNLGIFQRLAKTEFPPISALISMMVYLTAVIYVGLEFDAIKQLYGGILGMTMTVACLFITLKNK